MKNHHKHPVGSAPLPEVHNIQKNAKNKKFNGTTPKNRFGKRKQIRGRNRIHTRGTKTMRDQKMTTSV